MKPDTNSSAHSVLHIKEVHRLFADFTALTPWPAFRKLLTLDLLIAPCFYMIWASKSPLETFFWFLPSGFFLACLMITTHDAVHHTLTGIRWLDELLGRSISWPISWPHGTFAEIHRLHHLQNAVNLNDPERIQWTQEEYDAANALQRFYVRHLWVCRVFILGGVGLIITTLVRGWKLGVTRPALKRQVILDLIGIVSFNIAFFGIMFALGQGQKAVLFWFLTERITGFVLQLRALVEHYGMWSDTGSYMERQVYGSRNVPGSPLLTWILNGLNYHSVHHMHPGVPFYHLELAHKRMQCWMREKGLSPALDESNYLKTAWKLSRHFWLIHAKRHPSGADSRNRQIVTEFA